MSNALRAIALAAVIVMVASVLVQHESDAVEYTDDSGFVFETGTNNRATVTGYQGSETELTIPSTVEINGRTYTVNQIGDNAFAGCSFASITIPGTVTTIGEYAFYEVGLTSVTLSEGLTTIGAHAFEGNPIAELDLPGSLLYLRESAFAFDTALETVEIPSRLSTYDRAFMGCSSLESITVASGNSHFSAVDGILFDDDGKTLYAYPAAKPETSYTVPEAVTNISSGAFLGNSSLKTVAIGTKVTAIGDGAFSGCGSLSTISVGDNKAFQFTTGMLIGNSGKDVISYANGVTGSTVAISAKVTTIGEYAFYNAPVTSVTFPASLTSIETSAFEGCAVTSVTLPSSLDRIGDAAFYSSALTSVTVPEGVLTVGSDAFSNCEDLVSATFPSSVHALSDYTFYHSQALESFTWAGAATGTYTMGKSVFYQDTALDEVELPDRLTTIGDSAFAYSGITGFEFPGSVTTLGQAVFLGTPITSVTVPGTIETIPNAAFAMTGLTSVTLQEGIESIGQYAFRGCTGLKSVALPSTLTILDNGAFYMCDLSSVTIPEGVEEVGSLAFAYNQNMVSVTIPSTLTSMDGGAFKGCQSLTTVTVAEGSEDFAVSDGVLFSKNMTTLVLYPAGTEGASYEVPDGVTTIGKHAFEFADGLSVIKIPESVTLVCESAFSSCYGITQMAIASTDLTVDRLGFGFATDQEADQDIEVTIYTDLEMFQGDLDPAFVESAFGDNVVLSVEPLSNFGMKGADELMDGALLWVVVAIVLGVIFLAVALRSSRN